MKKNLKKGFTLTELVVVIVIIGILASVLIPTLTSYITRSRKSAAEQEATSYVQEAAAYVLDNDNEAWFAWNEYMMASVVQVEANGYHVVFDKGQLKVDLTQKDSYGSAAATLTYVEATTGVGAHPAYYLLTFAGAAAVDSAEAELLSKLGLSASATTIYVLVDEPVLIQDALS